MQDRPRVYLDHAASTPLLKEAEEAMAVYAQATGNPSATHMHGRLLRVGLEQARKQVAEEVGAVPGEIFFTSSATEANNWALGCMGPKEGMRTLITSPLEHASVRETLLYLSQRPPKPKLIYLPLNNRGEIDAEALRKEIGRATKPLLISLMYANNEIGCFLPPPCWEVLREVITEKDVYIHSDMVQAIGYLDTKLCDLPVHVATASGHKVHGPRGVGFLYVRSHTPLLPLLRGGEQERGLRAGTEPVATAVGMATALSYLRTHAKEHLAHLRKLKSLLITGLVERIDKVSFYGESQRLDTSLTKLVNVALPPTQHLDQETLLMRLDMAGISASVGAACASGSLRRSAVMEAIAPQSDRLALRLSFSYLTQEEDIAYCLDVLEEITQKNN